jgi:nitrogen fixation protein NifU and related proteins
MYQEMILQHYRAPHGRGLPTGAAVHEGARRNPLCGDDMRVGVVLEGDRIHAVGFEGRGCSITMASASMLTDAVRGHSVHEARALAAAVEALLRGEVVREDALTGDLRALAGVAAYPQRVGCARMPWLALLDALDAARS